MIASNLGVVGVGQIGKNEKLLAAADSGVEPQGIGLSCFRVAGNFLDIRQELVAVAVVEDTGRRIAGVVGIILFEGNTEIIEVSFPEGIVAFCELQAVADEANDGENGDKGNDDQKLDKGKATFLPRLVGHKRD